MQESVGPCCRLLRSPRVAWIRLVNVSADRQLDHDPEPSYTGCPNLILGEYKSGRERWRQPHPYCYIGRLRDIIDINEKCR